MVDVTEQSLEAIRIHNQGYRGRVRTGCMTCRTRKVRCDELKPICNNCSKGKRQCSYRPLKSNHPVPNESRRVEGLPVHSPIANDSRQRVEAKSSTPSFTSPPYSEHNEAFTEDTPHLDYASIPSLLPGPDRFQVPDSPAIDVIARLESALQHQNDDGSFTIEGFEVANSSASILISRDIKLTTTMDILAAGEIPWKPWMTFFVEEVNFPIITPYDGLNWQRAKREIVDLGTSTPAIASAIIALSAIYKGQVLGLPLSRAHSLYRTAKTAYERLLMQEPAGFNNILITVFLLSLFSFIDYEADRILMEPHAILVQKLEEWTLNDKSHCALSLRLAAWLRLLQVAAIRGGGTGLISEAISTHFSRLDGKFPNLKLASNQPPEASSHLFEMLSTPIFEFYFSLQMLSGDLTKLTHYRRSRVTGTDQEDVVQQISHNKSRLQTLWTNRSPVQQQTPEDLRASLAPQIAEPIIALTSICEAAYHTEFMEMHRILGDPLSESIDAKNAMRILRKIIESDLEVNNNGKLNPGYLRPLFMYAIESMDRERTDWAVDKIEKIQNPICRSSFFASFAKALSDAQLLKDRRVAYRYFAIWYFGSPPPFM